MNMSGTAAAETPQAEILTEQPYVGKRQSESIAWKY